MDNTLHRNLTVILLTFNEENNITRVLNNLRWVERIVVVDSFSTDRTLQILEKYPNVSIHYRQFDSFAGQCNYALTLTDTDWVLSLDADYVLPKEFAKEVQFFVDKNDSENVAYFCCFHFLVFGKKLLNDNTTPRAVLFKPAYCTYYDDGHAHRLKINGAAGNFKSRILHDDRKSLSRWLNSQSVYSLKETQKLTGASNLESSFISNIRKTKILAPLFIFFYCLFIKGLIFNGWRGWYYTLQRTIVEMLFALRLIEHDSFQNTDTEDEIRQEQTQRVFLELDKNKPHPLKILHITPSYKPAYVYGGPIESVAKLCEGLIQAEQNVHVYTTTANGDTELPVVPNETVLVDGVPVTYFTRITKDNTYMSPRLWKRVYDTCRDYDLVHIHSWWNAIAIISAMICHARKVKVVLSPRGMLSDYIFNSTNSRLKKIVHSIVGRNALKKSHFHATAPIEFEECTRLILGWQGFMVPNLITLPSIPVEKTTNEVFTLLFLSRIHPKKGIEFLIEALLSLNNIVLKIAGSGDEDYIDQLKQKVKALGVEKKVVWLGWKGREEKFIELMKADLFVLISYNENFANSVIESLHMGTPVLISDMVGLAPFIKETKMGWITDLDSKEVAGKLQFIMGETVERQRIQKESRQVVDTAFSEKRLIVQYIEQYEAYIAS